MASGVTGLNPEIMGLGPIEAFRQALKRANMTIDDIDLVEINEAFAAQVVPSARHLGIPLGQAQLHGGAIALGHPFGMTGARIMTTLINGLQDSGQDDRRSSPCASAAAGHGHDHRAAVVSVCRSGRRFGGRRLGGGWRLGDWAEVVTRIGAGWRASRRVCPVAK